MAEPKSKKLKADDELDNPFVFEKGVTDVVLKVGELKIHANKGVLITCSQFFKDLILLCTDENEEIEIKENPSSFLAFFKCMYPSIWEPISTENLDYTLELADKYGISPPLLTKCDVWLNEYLRRNHFKMKTKDVIGCIEKAERYDLKKTMETAITMMKHFNCSEIFDSMMSDKTKWIICKNRLLRLEHHSRYYFSDERNEIYKLFNAS